MYDFTKSKDPREIFHPTLSKGFMAVHSRTHDGCWVLLRVLPNTQSRDHDYFCGFYGATTYKSIALVAWQPEAGYEPKRIDPEQIQSDITVENDYHEHYFSDVTDPEKAWESFLEVLKKEGVL